MRIALLSPAVGTPNVGDRFIEAAVRRLLSDEVVYQRFSTRRTLTDGEIAAIDDNDAALLCGTNLYQQTWHSEITPSVLRRLQVPVVPVGVGTSAATFADVELSQLTQEMVRALHDRCSFGGVRDPFTLEVVGLLGVGNAMLTGCPVLFWAQQETLPPTPDPSSRRLVVTARNWLMHRPDGAVDHPVQVDLLRRIFDEFVDDGPILAIHEEWDESLAELLGLPEEMIFRSDEYEDYVGLYTNPENAIFAMRLHAGMLGLANGVPAVFVGHDTRTYSFCEMLDVPSIELFAPNVFEQCRDQIRSALHGELALASTTYDRFAELRASMTTFLRANDLPARQDGT